MLELLARQAGEGVPYERLERYVWPDAKVERQQVSYHRRKLEEVLAEVTERSDRFIETHASWGLRLCLSKNEIRIEEKPGNGLLESPPWELAINSIARAVFV